MRSAVLRHLRLPVLVGLICFAARSAAAVRPSIAWCPVRTGRNCARTPAPTTQMKNAAVITVAGMI